MSSAERRITVLASIYPKLKAWADRDGLTVADVANAILLQTVLPYGAPTGTQPTILPSPALDNSLSMQLPGQLDHDPYAVAAVDSW